MSSNLYGIMIKYPEPGKVKTRLAGDIGPEKAALVCGQIAERVMLQTMPEAYEYDRIVFFDPPGRNKDFMSWFPDEKFMVQEGGDIGERMDNAILRLLEVGAEKAVITGSDIPKLTSGIIAQAFELLDRTDVVIGPARDGGYYLIGMKSSTPELFRNIPWGTADVYSETLRVLERSGNRWNVLPRLYDLDTAEDLQGIVII